MSIKIFLQRNFPFIVSLAINLLLLVWLTIQIIPKKKEKVIDPNANLKAELENLESKYALMENLLLADTWIITDNHQEALVFFEELIGELPIDFQTIVQKRIEYINTALKMDGYEDEMIKRYKTELTSLNDQLNSLNSEFESKTIAYDSLKKASDGKIDRLERDLKAKNQIIDRKEKVRVISFNSSKGITVHYLGEVEDGKAQGGGLGIWITGSKYQGEWKENLRHGKGVFTWADGEKYDGYYVNDIRHGEGTYYWPSGDRYEGQWRNDRRNGQGTLYDKDGNIRYRGTWQDDKPMNK